ncbi:MAG: hypothetical protein JXA71_19705 [Chitinispirillaceae bacterium]|nr:hypothetical protein [Chitinispirillaceae bacterium]
MSRFLVLALISVFCISSLTFSSGTSSGWPSNIPKPADETVATKVNWIWNNVIKQTVTEGRGRGTYTNFFDQLHASAAMGKFQVCIRWDSHSKVTPAQRDCIEGMLQRIMGNWTTVMKGYDGWPWDTIPIRISGWACYNASDLGWTADQNNGVPIYPGDVSFENAPQCPQNCGRFFHTDKNYTYPNCSGGAKNHYDFSSWHSDVMDGPGFGSDWGQRTRANATLSGCSGHMGIIQHEMGHGFYLPDFYDWTCPGGNPACVMNAGSSMYVTEYDKWMLRRVYSEMKRQSGRLPAVKVTATAKPATYRNQFIVEAVHGVISIKAPTGTSRSLQVGIYNLSGKSLASAAFSNVEKASLAKVFAHGMYVVKITGSSINKEVHRINIAD